MIRQVATSLSMKLSYPTPPGPLTVRQGELQFLAPLFSTFGSVPFLDYRDQLDLPDADWFHEPITVETRQCLEPHWQSQASPESPQLD